MSTNCQICHKDMCLYVCAMHRIGYASLKDGGWMIYIFSQNFNSKFGMWVIHVGYFFLLSQNMLGLGWMAVIELYPLPTYGHIYPFIHQRHRYFFVKFFFCIVVISLLASLISEWICLGWGDGNGWESECGLSKKCAPASAPFIYRPVIMMGIYAY